MKTVTVVGARPQFVKAAVVSRELRSRGVDDVILHTGQHYDDAMSAVFFRECGLPAPRYNLEVGSGSHGYQTARMLEGIEQTLLTERPNFVVVYGDTNSTLAGALAASKLQIECAHVEAGLRSYNRQMPEEINRVVADHTCTVLFAPNESSRATLLQENICASRVHVSGDVMFDAALAALSQLQAAPRPIEQPYIVATFHRAENLATAANLNGIVEALMMLARTHVVLTPLHPGTRRALDQAGVLEKLGTSIRIVEPLGYHDMLTALKHAELVVTDSGGLQKEAFFCGVPCVTVRTETEWTELVDCGWNRLAAPDNAGAIVAACQQQMSIDRTMARPDLYGGGNAAKRIVDELLKNRRPGSDD